MNQSSKRLWVCGVIAALVIGGCVAAASLLSLAQADGRYYRLGYLVVLLGAAAVFLFPALTKKSPPAAAEPAVLRQSDATLLALLFAVVNLPLLVTSLPDFLVFCSTDARLRVFSAPVCGRPVIALLGLVITVVLLIAAFRSNGSFRDETAAARRFVPGLVLVCCWTFGYTVTESAAFVALPDILLYAQRVFLFYAFGMFACTACCAICSGKRELTARLPAYAQLGWVFGLADTLFWIFYHDNPFVDQGLHSLLFSLLGTLFFFRFALCFPRRGPAFCAPDLPDKAEDTDR